MQQGLLVIDVQNDYFSGGKCELFQSQKARENINLLVESFNQKGSPVIYIQHIKDDENADFFARNSDGVKLHRDLRMAQNNRLVTKKFPNSFLGTNLYGILKELKVEQLVIVGMMTHMCIDSTTRAAKEKGFSPIVVSDCTATKDLSYLDSSVDAEAVQTSFLSALRNFALLQLTNEFLNEN